MADRMSTPRRAAALLIALILGAIIFFQPAYAENEVFTPAQDSGAVAAVVQEDAPADPEALVADEGDSAASVASAEQAEELPDASSEIVPAEEEPSGSAGDILPEETDGAAGSDSAPSDPEAATTPEEGAAEGEGVEEGAEQDPADSDAAADSEVEEASAGGLSIMERQIVTGWEVKGGSVYYTDPATGEKYAGGFKTIVGLTAPIVAAKGAVFSDTSSSTPHNEDIDWLLLSGISTGWVSGSTRTFRPMTKLARADMAAFLYRLAGSPDYTPSTADKSYFSDVTSSTPHAKEIWWLASMKISEGFGSGAARTFRPYSSLARADMAAFLYRLAGSPNYTPTDAHMNYFSDITSSTPHAKEIWWLASTAVSEGFDGANGTHFFGPYYTLVRQDMAAFLRRMMTRAGFEPYASHKYLFSNDGKLVTGWSEIGGNTYYLDPNTGVIYVSGTYKIDGKYCRFDESGKLVETYTDVSNAPAWSLTDQGYVNNKGQIIEGAVAKGIDVSEWNGTIDWAKVKADGISFAILRVGYGCTVNGKYSAAVDDMFSRNASECERLGIPYGVYLYSYAKDASQAAAEAEATIGFLKGRKLSYPVYIDIEDPSQNKLKPADFEAMATAFCTRIEKAGYEPGVYSMLSWWDNNFTSKTFDKWSKWIAQIYSTCEYSGSYRLWQCSWTGKVSGISGNVDLNFDFGAAPGQSASGSTTGRVLDNGVYEIAPASASSLVFGVEGSSKNDRANIRLETDADEPNQRFRITWDSASEAYMITNMNSGCVMDLAGSKAVAGANIQQYHTVGWLDQRWVITKTSTGYLIASAVNPAFYLCLSASTPTAGTNVQLGTTGTAFSIRAV